MTNLTPDSGNNPATAKDMLRDLMTDSTLLVGLVQAVSILVDEAGGGQYRHAGNALHALLPEVERKAEELAANIERLDRVRS